MEELGLSIHPTELFLMIGISFIGALLHEYIVSIKKNHIKKFITLSTNIFISVLIDVITCISINQLILSISPRLVLLPPLIIGLVGKEFVETLTTLKASSRLIAFLFSLFGVGNNEGIKSEDEKETEEESEEEHVPTEEDKQEKIKRFEAYTERILNDMNSLIANKVNNSIDDTKFIIKYKQIKVNTRIIKQQIKNDNIVSVKEALKISEIVKNEEYLDGLYRNIMDKRGTVLPT